jgi:hypothetical protein
MAVSIPIVTEFINDGIKKAERAFVDIRKQVSQAEGTMGKFKAASKGVFDAVSENATAFALAGASAFATFAAKGVTAFQTLALQSDKFASATGLAVEEASRLLEVTGDLSIDAGAVEKHIGKMNEVLGKSPDLFKKLGIQVAYAKDGTVDANETFLNVIDRLHRIKDPTERAAVAAQVLGKGWRSMSELIQMGADDLRKSLATVSDAKTISPEEVAKAKKFRDNMNNLKDTVEDLSLQIGEVLVPAIASIVEEANKLQIVPASTGLFQSMFGTPSQKFQGQMLMVQSLLQAFGIEFDKQQEQEPLISDEQIRNMKAAADELDLMNQHTLDVLKYGKMKPFEELSTSAGNLATQLDNINEAWDRLTGKLDMNVTFDRATTQLEEMEAAAAKAFATGADSDIAAYNEAAATFVGTLALIAEGLGKIASREVKIRFEAEGGAAALALAAWYRSGGELTGLNASQLIGASGFSFSVPARANGGPVTAGGTYLVGERGPELLTMGARGGYVTPNNAMGATVNVTVTSADPNQVVAAIQRWVRDNGAVPMTTTTAIRR